MGSAWWVVGAMAMAVPAVLVGHILVGPAHAQNGHRQAASARDQSDDPAEFGAGNARNLRENGSTARPSDDPPLRLPGALPPLKGVPPQQLTVAVPQDPAAISPTPQFGQRMAELDAAAQTGCTLLDNWTARLEAGEKLDWQGDVLPVVRSLGDQMAHIVMDPSLTEAERTVLMQRMEAKAKPSVDRFTAAMQAHGQSVSFDRDEPEPADGRDDREELPVRDPAPEPPLLPVPDDGANPSIEIE